MLDNIQISQVGAKININLNTKNIFEPGSYYSYLGPGLNTSNEAVGNSLEGTKFSQCLRSAKKGDRFTASQLM